LMRIFISPNCSAAPHPALRADLPLAGEIITPTRPFRFNREGRWNPRSSAR
jgi:hypothetical protein